MHGFVMDAKGYLYRIVAMSIPAVHNARTRDTEKAERMALGASQVGVVPVEGQGFDDESRRRSTFENSLEKRFSSRTPPAQGGAVSASPNIPIEATRVLEDDAKIEAQVQALIDKLIANITVPVNVQPGGEIEENDKKSTQPNRKRICFFAFTAVLLILAVAVGTGVGVAISSKSNHNSSVPTDTFPTSTEAPPTNVPSQAFVITQCGKYFVSIVHLINVISFFADFLFCQVWRSTILASHKIIF
jgi:hypothetical protein